MTDPSWSLACAWHVTRGIILCCGGANTQGPGDLIHYSNIITKLSITYMKN